jgi:predicted small secreted protein
MKRIGKAFPLIAATMLLAGCGSVDGVGPESVAAGATGGIALQDGRSLPDWHPPLPRGHPPLTQGPTRLPPGHPAVPEGLVTCPAGGVVGEPDIDRFRDFKADPRDIIRI